MSQKLGNGEVLNNASAQKYAMNGGEMNSISCTIVSSNYLAYAATLRDSLAVTDPDLPFKVLVVDQPSSGARDAIAFLRLDVIWLEDLCLADLPTLAFRYSILELNTNVKPSFISYLLRAGYQRVFYCDPDTYFYSSLEAAVPFVDTASVCLTPHLLTMTGGLEDEEDLLQTGVFNLGFLCVKAGEETNRFLDWWGHRCFTAAYDDMATGQYVDQKWIDLLPCFVKDFQILRHLGCNVAHWNIQERPLSVVDGRYIVGGDALVFFHFSGLSDSPRELSKRKAIPKGVDSTLLLQLATQYREALQLNGHSDLRVLKYGFSQFSDGSSILPIHRVALSHFLTVERVSDPFDVSGPFATCLRRSCLWPRRGSRDGAFRPDLGGPDKKDARRKRISKLLSIVARLVGPTRYWYLCKYLSLNVSPINQRDTILELLGKGNAASRL